MVAAVRYEDKWVSAAGLRTRYWQVGEGPPVVLIHGIGGHVGFWRPCIEGLAPSCTVYAPDLFGHGHSEAPASLSRQVFGGWLAEFLDKVVGTPTALVGASMGGGVALAAALDHPGCIAALVLVDTVGFGSSISPLFRLLTVPGLGEMILPPRSGPIKRGMLSLTFGRDWLWDGLVEETTSLAQLPGANAFFFKTLRWGVGPFKGVRKHAQAIGELHRLTVPVQLIWGAQDKVFPLADAKKAARLISDVELKVLDRCGHMPFMERPQEFNAILLEFLARNRQRLERAAVGG